MSETYEPVIVGFLCNWCSYRAADLAGTARIKYAPNMRSIRVMCSGGRVMILQSGSKCLINDQGDMRSCKF